MRNVTKFELERTKGSAVSDDDLLADLRTAASESGESTIGLREYRRVGKYADTTISRRFGSWNEALRLAGLEISNEIRIPEKALFENILALWSFYGRQPRRNELALPPSKYSQSPYLRTYGSWGKALQLFVDYANAAETTPPRKHAQAEGKGASRDPSLRLRWKVFVRDRFACTVCGSSPAMTAGVELHLDHIAPWSKGGPTTAENLRILCSQCNLGKGALED